MCCISGLVKAPLEHCPFPICKGVLLVIAFLILLLFYGQHFLTGAICFSMVFPTFFNLFISVYSGMIGINSDFILCIDFISLDQKMNQEKIWGYLCDWFWFLSFWSFGWQTPGLAPLFIRSLSATYSGYTPEPMLSCGPSDRAKEPAIATKQQRPSPNSL